VLIGGWRYPLVGTVSMDNITVDLGADPRVVRLQGEGAILIGSEGSERITSEDVARRLDTINYEVTCALTPRVPRVYHRDGALLDYEDGTIGGAGARASTPPVDASTA
jgi:alanine racemase